MGSHSAVSRDELETAVRQFDLDGELHGIEELRRGHIHDTFVSTWAPAPGQTGARRFLHQRMNSAVFGDIPALMHNVALVTKHLSEQPRGTANESTSQLTALQLVRARDGGTFVVSGDAPWRTYHLSLIHI